MRAERPRSAEPSLAAVAANPVSPAWFRGPAGWCLTPEGAAVHPRERLAVIADVHLGYEWARGAGGDCIPAHSFAETQAKLERLLASAGISRLVVAGDLVESPSPCRRTLKDVSRLSGWLASRGVALTPLAGNHDPRQVPPLPETLEIAGWTLAHGHRPLRARRSISGHLHPVLRADGVTAPCFLVGPNRIVLPAFSPNAAGWNVGSQVVAAGSLAASMRCVASAGDVWLDFGPIESLAIRLASR